METLKQTLTDRHLKTKLLFDDIDLTNAYQEAPLFDVVGTAKASITIQYQRGSGEPDSVLNFKISYSLDNGNTFNQEGSGTSAIALKSYTVNPGTSSSVNIIWAFDVHAAHLIKISAKESDILQNYGKLTMIIGTRP